MNIKIAIAYHKHSKIISNDVFIPLQVGASLNKTLNLNIPGDNTGDNISKENTYYCELTALYWIWKNITADYKGLFHYRRFLTLSMSAKSKALYFKEKILGRSTLPLQWCSEEEFIKRAHQFSHNIYNFIGNFDIITTKLAILKPNIELFFSRIDILYIELMKESIRTHFPDLYSVCLKQLYSTRMHFGNISIMENSVFEEYCTFIFSILENIKSTLIEQKYIIDLCGEEIFSRKLGYIAEILTSIFIESRKKDRILSLPVALYT